MRRRDFIKLGGATAAWPVMARAQRSGAMRRIAVVGSLAPDDVETIARSAAGGRGDPASGSRIPAGLAEAGHVEALAGSGGKSDLDPQCAGYQTLATASINEHATD